MDKGHRSQIKRERETIRRMRDHQQTFLTLEYLFRKLVSCWMRLEVKMWLQRSVS